MSVNASSDDHNQSKWKVPCGALRAPYGRGNACDLGAAGGGSSAAIANFGPREYLPTPTANSRRDAWPYLPTPPPALNSESARPPGGRSGTCLPLRGACLPHDHTYLPSRRFFQLQRSPTCPGKETQPRCEGSRKSILRKLGTPD